MGKADIGDLLKFLNSVGDEAAERILWLRDFIWEMYPKTNELIYDNYNAIAIGWSITERLGHTFCSIAVYRSNKNIHFGFYWGNEIADPENKLLGQGNQYPYIRVPDQKTFPKTYIKKLVKEVYANSLAKVKKPEEIRHGLTIVKFVSAAKREKQPALKKEILNLY